MNMTPKILLRILHTSDELQTSISILDPIDNKSPNLLIYIKFKCLRLRPFPHVPRSTTEYAVEGVSNTLRHYQVIAMGTLPSLQSEPNKIDELGKIKECQETSQGEVSQPVR